jgi:phage-related protein
VAKTLTVKINGDASGLSKALGQAEGDVDGFGSKLGGFAKGAGLAIGGIVLAGAALAPAVLSAGASMEALANKSATVFEGSLGDVQAWARENSAALGMTASQLTGTAAGFADLLKPMGFTAAQAADMSKQTMGLAGALSAWSGGTMTATEVSDTLAKAMLGETDGLKALGISISAADVEARLAANGTDKLTGSALEQAKALAVQQLVMEKSTDAQKAWADGSMDSIKGQNEMKASLENLKETAIKSLYPLFQKAVPMVTSAITAAQQGISSFVGAFQNAGDGVTSSGLNGQIERFAILARGVYDAVVAAWPTIKAIVVDVVGAIVSGITTYVVPAVQQLVEWFGMAVTWTREHWGQIQAGVTDVITTIQNVITTVIDVLSAAWSLWGDNLVAFAQGAWGWISQTISGALDVIMGVWDVFAGVFSGDWSRVWDGIKGILSGVLDIIKGLLSGAWDAIKLAAGIAWDGIKLAASTAWDGIKSLVSTGVDEVVGFVTGLPDKLLDLASTFLDAGVALGGAILDGIKDGLTAAAGFVADIAGAMKKAVIGAINWVIDKLNSGIPDQLGSGILSIDLPDNPIPRIPTYHTGGWVDGAPGSEQLAILQAGEYVMSRDEVANGSPARGGLTITNLNVSDGRSIYSELQTLETLYGYGMAAA